MSRFKIILTTSILAFVFTCLVSVKILNAGENPYPVAEPRYEGSIIIFNPVVQYEIIVLKVSGPDGSVFYKEFDSGSSPIYEVREAGDGSFTYQLYVVEKLGSLERRIPDDGVSNGRGPDPYGPGLQQTGSFTVVEGRIVTPTGPGEGDRDPAKSMSQGISTTQDFVINDDLIVDGSACIGFDCVNGESFGFDTIRLKENNLRIKFDDTSTIASYPRNDWQITINSSVNGGGSYFAIDDITGSKTPFTIEAGARSNSLYVDDGGRLGLRTSTPSVEIHTVDGDTPTLRLQQDGSSGFAPQTWDVAGNETNFFIRDVTNGSTLPFRIQPDAPSSSLTIKADGKIGIGTWSPGWPVEVETSGEDSSIVLERADGGPYRGYFSMGQNYFFAGSITAQPLRFVTGGSYKMQVETNGDLTMASGGGIYNHSTGQWVDGSSREYKEDIEALDVEAAMSALNELKPVTFRFKISEKDDKQVGFIAEDVPDLVAQSNRKGLSAMDIVAVLTKVTQEQQKTIEKLTRRIEQLEKQNSEKE